jgi:hypothetical protein
MMKALMGWRRQAHGGLPAPRVSDRVHTAAERLFWGWCALAGVMVFAAWWLQGRGVWRTMIDGDPSGISVGIVVLAVIVTGWCGMRARTLTHQATSKGTWRAAYVDALARDGVGQEAALQRLAEHTHGPHETAWWFAGAAIKLGLLGTVVGFMVMSLQIGRMPSFDFDQVQVLLKRMTEGMAIALYTTLAGLIANLGLGFQLMLLDRQADALAADILARGDAEVPVAGTR